MRPHILVVLAVIILSPALASAQSIEVFGNVGFHHLWDDEGRIGSGVPVGGGIGFRSPHGWGVEGLVDVLKATRDFDSGVSFDSTSTSVRGRLLKYFGSGQNQPYAGGGFGVTRIESSRTEPPTISSNVFRSESTSGTLSGFAGLRIAVGTRGFVRPEFEISKSGEYMRLGGNVSVGLSW